MRIANRPPQPPRKPAVAKEVALTTTVTALAGGTVAYVLTGNPQNLVHNLTGGLIAGSMAGPAAASWRMARRGDEGAQEVADGGLNGVLLGAGLGAVASLGLSLVLPDSAGLQLAALACMVGGAVGGGTWMAQRAAG